MSRSRAVEGRQNCQGLAYAGVLSRSYAQPSLLFHAAWHTRQYTHASHDLLVIPLSVWLTIALLFDLFNATDNPCNAKITSRITQFLKTGETTVLRFKLLFLGPGGVGKTSVIKRLNGGEFNAGLPATDGMEVVPMTLLKTRKSRSEVQ